MEVITPFDFVEMFPEGRTLAIVGNAHATRSYLHGELIDGHEYVARFNECAIEGYRDYVGKRTSILVCNPYAETRSRPLLDGGMPDVVLTIGSQTRRGDRGIFQKWVGEAKVLFTYSPDLVNVEESSHSHGLTTGTYGIQLLWRVLRPSSVFITGFSMFASGEPSHYWTNEQSPGLRAHDTDAEAKIFVRLLNSIKCPVRVTPEVFAISERTGVPFKPHVKLFES